MTKYSVRKETLFTSFEALWSALLAMAKDSGEIYCIIDALGECTPDSQETLLSQLAETFHQTIGGSVDLGIYILVTSRPYEEIGRHLRQFYHHDLSSFSSLRHDVDLLIEKKVDELSRRNTYPQTLRQEVASIPKDKADGTSLWVGKRAENCSMSPPRMLSRHSKSYTKIWIHFTLLFSNLRKTILRVNSKPLSVSLG
jgi:hypothetical protein